MWCSWYGYHGMYYPEHHNGLGLLSSVLEGFSGEAIDHGGDATSGSVVHGGDSNDATCAVVRELCIP